MAVIGGKMHFFLHISKILCNFAEILNDNTMKRLTLVFAIILSYTIVCSASNLNFEDYIYPFGCRTYSSFDSKGNVSSMTQYSFESQNFDNYLVEEEYIGIGADVNKLKRLIEDGDELPIVYLNNLVPAIKKTVLALRKEWEG